MADTQLGITVALRHGNDAHFPTAHYVTCDTAGQLMLTDTSKQTVAVFAGGEWLYTHADRAEASFPEDEGGEIMM